MLVAQVLTLRNNLVIVYIHHPSHHPDLLPQSVVIVCALLASRIASAAMIKDRGPVGSGVIAYLAVSKPHGQLPD